MILRFKIDSLENVTKLLVATTMGRKKADLVIKDGPFAGMHALLE